MDALKLNFSPDSLFLLNICLAIIMFGIALDIRIEDFRLIIRQPRTAILGLISQFLLLPLLTFLLILWLKPMPSIALGMMLVAACPGGNISNFLSHLAGANSALSVSLTAVATLLSLVLTPLNFELYANLYEPTRSLLQSIEIPVASVIKTILIIIAVPLALGILIQYRFPRLAAKVAPVLKVLSIFIFLAFIAVAFFNNYDLFINYVDKVLLLVLLHNGLAYLTGYSIGRLGGLGERECRTLTIETGIQNSGLGLVLIFAFFEGLGGMAFVTGWWGIWHIISGLSLAFLWNRRTLPQESFT